MTYFDDQFEAWEENNCQGDPSDYEADEVADLLIDKEERTQKTSLKIKSKNMKTESDFGKGLVYNLILFANHFNSDILRDIGRYAFVMNLSPTDRKKFFSNKPPDNLNYGWNERVKWWFKDIVPIWRSEENALSEQIRMWANGATDHLYELQIPKEMEKIRLGKMIKKLQNKGLEMGHGFNFKKTYTLKDVEELVELTKKIGLALDNHLGIKPVKATWE